MSYNPTPTLKGFTMLPNSALFDKRLSAVAKILYMVLTYWTALYSGKKGGRRWNPSIPLLCQWTGVSERTFLRARQELIDTGYLTVESGGGRRIRSIYTLHPSGKPPQIEGGIAPKTPANLRDETPANLGRVIKKRSEDSEKLKKGPAKPTPSQFVGASSSPATATPAAHQPRVAPARVAVGPPATVPASASRRLSPSATRGRVTRPAPKVLRSRSASLRTTRASGAIRHGLDHLRRPSNLTIPDDIAELIPDSPAVDPIPPSRRVAPRAASAADVPPGGGFDPERGPYMLLSNGERIYVWAKWDKEGGHPIVVTDSDPMDTTDPERMWSWVQRIPESRLSAHEREWVKTEQEYRQGKEGRRDWSVPERRYLTAVFIQRVRPWYAETHSGVET